MKTECDYHGGELVAMVMDLLLSNTLPMTARDLADYFNTSERNMNVVMTQFKSISFEFMSIELVLDKKELHGATTYNMKIKGVNHVC